MDLVGGLDVRPRVEVEDRVEPGLLADFVGTMEVVDEDRESLGREPRLGMLGDASGPAQAVLLREPIAEDCEAL